MEYISKVQGQISAAGKQSVSRFFECVAMLKIKEKPIINARQLDLMARLKETHSKLSAMQSAFEHETDFDLIEVYILEIDSLEHQYSYLLKQAKAGHVSAF